MRTIGRQSPWMTHAGAPTPRPRPDYRGMAGPKPQLNPWRGRALNLVEEVSCLSWADPKSTTDLEQACQSLRAVSGQECDMPALIEASFIMANSAQKDMVWHDALGGPDRAKVLKAFETERDSLESTILSPILSDHSRYNEAVETATPGRWLLDIKRNGTFKVRGVKQGFKEDKLTADGPDFNYYAHVAKLNTVRTAIFRKDRGDRNIAVQDVSTAFLQSDPYPDGQTKLIKFKNPITGQWEYWEQSGPIYGEASAPVRWEKTIGPWLESQGFAQGKNEPCAYYHSERDLLVLLYVDDLLYDGQVEDIEWISSQLDSRFKCKPIEWLTADHPIDFIGMVISIDKERIYLSMEKYILHILKVLGLENIKTAPTPIHHAIDEDSEPLSSHQRRLFMTICGFLGWLSNTVRLDISYAYSRASQHMANPTKSAFDVLLRCMQYLKGSAKWCISSLLHPPDQPLSTMVKHSTVDKYGEIDQYGWEAFCDSDFAGNAEPSNKRRSQNGMVISLNGAPVVWGSKVSSVAFAHPAIGEAHADISSGGAEIYAAANATFDILHHSYCVDEMGIQFPKPIILQMDNSACEAFVNNSCYRSKLKHIDARQEWVQVLRNKNILVPKHVDTKLNLADIMTKILPKADFISLRSMMMYQHP